MLWGFFLSRSRCGWMLSKTTSFALSFLSCQGGSLHWQHLPAPPAAGQGAQVLGACHVQVILQPTDRFLCGIGVEFCLALMIWKTEEVKAGVAELGARQGADWRPLPKKAYWWHLQSCRKTGLGLLLASVFIHLIFTSQLQRGSIFKQGRRHWVKYEWRSTRV